MPSPMPPLPPVMMATLPVRSNSFAAIAVVQFSVGWVERSDTPQPHAL
jgi:hypothetical protein